MEKLKPTASAHANPQSNAAMASLLNNSWEGHSGRFFQLFLPAKEERGHGVHHQALAARKGDIAEFFA